MLLRLGTALVAWMVVYTHLIWLATLRIIDCGSDGDELWRLLLGFAPIAVGMSLLLTNTRALPTIHVIVRWFALPLLLFVPLAAIPVWNAFTLTTLGGESICRVIPAPWWHGLWAPVQALTLMWIVWATWRAWRAPH